MQDKIIIIGAAIIDVLIRPVNETILKTNSYAAEDIHMSPGGDALNEAVVLAALGKKVELRTVIGNDLAGDAVKAYCREYGISLSENAVRPEIPTGINVVMVRENGERSFCTNPHGSLRRLTLKDILMPFTQDAGILCFASIFVFPEIRTPELRTIFQKAKEQGMVVCADMTRRKNEERLADIAPALSLVDYLLPNEEEALQITDAETVEDAAGRLLNAGVKNVVIKCGSRGCLIKNREIQEWIPAEKNITCLDTTGAGDSFAAGFIYALSEGNTFRKCAEFANRCGARAVEHLGATDWVEETETVMS